MDIRDFIVHHIILNSNPGEYLIIGFFTLALLSILYRVIRQVLENKEKLLAVILVLALIISIMMLVGYGTIHLLKHLVKSGII